MKIMTLFGTRPEIIKLAPLVEELKKHDAEVAPVLVSTGQHKRFTEQMTVFFNLRPDYDLDIMKDRQTLAHIITAVIDRLDPILVKERPDILVVQGDTSSSTAGAIAASFRAIRVAHIEAGLRTPDKLSPFPEEINRRLTGVTADWHFAPTEWARQNLLKEGKNPATIHVTGNTIVDAMKTILAEKDCNPPAGSRNGCRELLVTVHRRENFGKRLRRICYALRAIVDDHPDVRLTFPVHWNPNVREPITKMLSGHPRIQLLKPFSYVKFLQALQRCHFVLTDSGGVQEEAPFLGKPVLVLREVTERPEAVEAGVAKLVGTDPYRIITAAGELLTDPLAYDSMSCRVSPFGDGQASERIVNVLLRDVAGLPVRSGAAAMFDTIH